MDVIACAKAGFDGALAPMGTALTEEQIMVLWRMIPGDEKVPILCFDGDAAGQRAAARACERILPLLKPNHSARFAFLPDGQDPDSLINSGGSKAFTSLIDAAMPLVDFLWKHHTTGKSFETPEVRAGLAHTLEQEVLRIPDRDVQHHYRQNLKNQQYQTFSPFKKGNNGRFNGSKGRAEFTGGSMKRPSFSRRTLVEKALLAAILNHPALFDMVEEDLGRLVMNEPRLDQMRQAAMAYLAENNACTHDDISNNLTNQGFESEIRGVLAESVYTHARFARPQSSLEEVESGWQNAIKALYSE